MPTGSGLEHSQHGADCSRVDVQLVGDLLDRDGQVALVVQAADQVLGDRHVLVVQVAPRSHQLLGQRLLGGDLRQRIEFLVVGRAAAARPSS